MTRHGDQDSDAVSLVSDGGQHCVGIVFVRGGRNLGTANFFPRAGLAESAELLGGFLSQYYLGRESPAEIILDQPAEDIELLAATLTERAERTVEIRSNVRGVRARWLEMAKANAELALKMRRATNATITEQLEALQKALSATRWASSRWLRASCSVPKARSRATIEDSTSKDWHRATTMAP
jgi:excinuclease ABC subunit C